MKKFFALVLALVMALSLTTVAWGAATELPAADANGVITLTENVTLTFTGNPGIALAAGTVIDGAGYTLTLEGNVGSYSSNAAIYNLNAGANVQVKDLVIDNNLISGYVFSFTDATLDNVDITGGNGLVVMTAGAAGDEIVVKNCEFTGFTGTAILTDSAPATPVSIEDSAFIGANTSAIAVIMRSSDSSSVGSTYSAKLNLYAAGTAENVVGNTFNARVKVYNDDETLTGNSFDADGYIELDDADFDVDASGNYWGGSAPTDAQLGGATATTYYTTDTGAGLSGMTSNVPATDNLTRYTLWGAKVAATATGVNYIATDMQLPTATKAVAPTATNLAGAVAYYTVGGSKYIKGTANDCDIYFTVKGKTTPVMYLKEIGTQNYWAVATEFTNFGKKCGQSDTVVTENTKYYTYTALDGTVYVHAEDTSVGAMANAVDFLLVGGKMVPVVPTNVYNEVAHTWTFAYDEAGKVVSAKCEDCGVTAKVYTTYTAVPAGAKYIREGAYFLVVNAPVVTDKVQSAETFDAGIAMYVGMSVMAAAGSVVVLKKKD